MSRRAARFSSSAFTRPRRRDGLFARIAFRRDAGRSQSRLPRERPDLWRQARVARHTRRGCVVWTASDRAIDAATGSQSASATASLPTCSTAPSKRPLPTANELLTSRTSGRRKAGSMWRPSSISSLGAWAGWSMSAAMTAQLVTDALMMAIWRRGKPDALLHHGIRISGLHHCSRPADIDGCTRSLRRTARILVGSRSTRC